MYNSSLKKKKKNDSILRQYAVKIFEYELLSIMFKPFLKYSESLMQIVLFFSTDVSTRLYVYDFKRVCNKAELKRNLMYLYYYFKEKLIWLLMILF